ncbi:MAG: AI-2E family transporter [candidate division KSB1 bacterium]|nr:AI-2E family transporter [candidate division KSB1 bacterium]
MPTNARQPFFFFSERQFAQGWRVLAALLLIAAVVVLIVLVHDLITPVVVSIFLAYLLAPLVDAMENRGVSRAWAVTMIFLGIAFALGLVISLLRQNIVGQLEQLIMKFQFSDTKQIIESLREGLKSAFPGLAQSNLIDKSLEVVVQFGETFIMRTMQGFAGVFSAIGGLIIIPFLTFFILKDSRSLKKNIVQRIPNRYFEMSLSLIHKASLQLGRFIRGQLLDATIVGIMAMIALSLLDLRYALVIGALAGMANLIPFLGPIVGGIPAVLIAIIDGGSFAAALPIIAAFAVIKLIDDVLVQPLVVSKSVELHPVTVIISIFAGGHTAGILGMVVAVPLVSIIKVSAGILYWGFTKYYIFGPPPYATTEGGSLLAGRPLAASPEQVAPATIAAHPTGGASPLVEIPKRSRRPQTPK